MTGDLRADEPIRETPGQGWYSHGYSFVLVPPELRHLGDGESNLAEHRFVVAQRLGRALTPFENVHHLNGDRTDNRLHNLELWTTAQPSGQRVQDQLSFAIRHLASVRTARARR